MGCASRIAIAPVALALALLSGALGAPDPDPLAAVAAAAGHPATLHLRAAATETRNGRRVEETLEALGPARLDRRCTDGLCGGTWFDGEHFARFGINGTPFPEPGDDDELRTYAAIASTAFAEHAFKGTVRREPGARADEERFRVTARGGAPLVAVADPHTSRLLRIERPDGSAYTALFANAAGGALLYAEAPYATVERVAGPLRPPSGPLATIPAPVELPLLSARLPVVPCSVDGTPAACLIDTGTTPSGVSLAFAEKLRREPHGEIEMSALGSYVTGAIDVQSVGLGAATLGPLHLAVFPNGMDVGFDVLLGSDALEALPLELDPGAHRVRLGTAPAADGQAIPLGWSRGVPYADVGLGTGARVPMLLDTGDVAVLSIGYDAYRRDLSLFVPSGNVPIEGLGGRSEAVVGRLAAGTVGTARVTDVEIRAVRGQHEGHVGYGFAQFCGRLRIEYARRRMLCYRP